MNGKLYHLNDRTSKYQNLAQIKRQHQYLKLPGEFKTRLPQEIVFPNMVSGRVDEFYYNNEGLLINFEEESKPINPDTLMKFAKYIIFASYWYSDGKAYLVVLCHHDPGKTEEMYEYAPSVHIKVHYIYIDQDSLWEKYDNLIKKVEQKKELSEMESLDIAFVCKFISKEYAPYVIETLSSIYKEAIIEDKLLKMDVGIILGGMILKHILNPNKQNRLLEMIDMRHIENELHKLVYDEYGDILDAKDKEIEEKNKKLETQNKKIENLNQTNKKYKENIKKLSKIKDLNSPKAKELINSLTLL